ncbi:MAG: HAD family hydrolase [Thiotrichales bacterium]|jgi:HAD superfamily hydrolase (TIGR01509 family)|nr:HAD family hydrolase [Thiotrichales bacterium]MBT3613843.1 HAD family hydrolase [Thiotrichales bacterium]MBT3752848.1 HAD family hydrolase [Thiotrichales bacterium]MBT3838216.1 HAD family hydrolase [Thiotrichales bacterium]MBT4151460.1 HAD family hydrolase [Thiotrichales bacterium]
MRALIFDVDGTLADTERDGHRVAFNLAFNEAGLEWNWSEELYGELLSVTGGKERILHFIDSKKPSIPKVGDMKEWIAELHAAKTRHFVKLLEDGKIPLRSGVRRLLTEAHNAKVTLAIATTTTPQNVSALLEYALFPGAAAWFKVIGAGDIIPNKKPAPDIYNYVLDELGLDAADCIAFEDSRNGILSSQAAGLKTVITVNGYTDKDDFSGAALVLDGLGEPDSECKVIAGDDADGGGYLNLEWISKL